MPLLGIGAWLGALAVLHVTWWQVCVLAVLSNGLALARRSVHLAAFSVAASAVMVVGLVDTSARTSGAVADLGEQRAAAGDRLLARLFLHIERALDDVLERGAMRKQIEALEHHRHACGPRGAGIGWLVVGGWFWIC